MQIKDVENLAQLARIELSSSEKEEILKDMDSILEYIKQIEQLPIKDVEQEFTLHNVWREDTLEPENPPEAGKFSKELIIEQFPNSQDGFLKVKKIM